MSQHKQSVQADLYTDNSADSRRAKKLLEENNISFDEWKSHRDYIPETGFNPPVLHAREGEFRGLERIQGYVALVSER